MQTDTDRPTQTSAIARLLSSFSRRGRDLFERIATQGPATKANAPLRPFRESAVELANALLSVRGEASGVAIAQDLLALYRQADASERRDFFLTLAERFDPDLDALEGAWTLYKREGTRRLPQLGAAVEAPRQELFRRLNLAPGGTATLVEMRADLLKGLKAANGKLDRVDADLSHLLQSWFNRGFLVLRHINWDSPASLLARVIRYEAVHDIRDWDDLRRRLDTADRRCFGFFHPAMPDEPLIFVEVALTSSIPGSIQSVLASERTPIEAADADTAVFYSISNCQDGLRGISLGHFLIKQVANDLKCALPNLRRFVTLSPIPGFLSWLAKHDPAALEPIKADGWWDDPAAETAKATLMAHAVDYFTSAKGPNGRPFDPVARFHLGNGARLERLNWLGDLSAKGMRQSAGLMVNYLYELSKIEENHEAYAEERAVIVSPAFKQAAETLGRMPSVKVG